MVEDFVTFHHKPKLRKPALIAGFGNWSNAGNVALKTIEYVVRKKISRKLSAFRIFSKIRIRTKVR